MRTRHVFLLGVVLLVGGCSSNEPDSVTQDTNDQTEHKKEEGREKFREKGNHVRDEPFPDHPLAERR